jgi:deoxyribonuclease IV
LPTTSLGPHLSLGAGLLKAADRARDIGATAVQIFTDNPTAWRRRREPPPDLAAFRARLAEYGIGPLAVHAPYLINLCGKDPDFWQRSVTTLVNELRVGADYGARFVVLHIGSHRGLGQAAGIERLAQGLRQTLDAAGEVAAGEVAAGGLPLLVLENSAGSGDGVGARLEELAEIVESAVREGVAQDRLGVCLDTAHLWAAGYQVDSADGVDQVARRAEQLLGRERVVMLHLNDARTAAGSRVDRHEHVGAGRIGGPALRAFLTDAWLGTLPTYLETPGMDVGYDAVNLDRVRLLLAGEELPPLPPEAFERRGSRSRSAPPAAIA